MKNFCHAAKFILFFLPLTTSLAFAKTEPAKKTQVKQGAKMTTLSRPVVRIETSLGAFELELDGERAPVTVQNFLHYVDSGFYNGTIFHRVIDGFMIQGGGMNEKMEQKTTEAPIKNEAQNGLKNSIGTIAMARTNDPNSATAQFFINVKDNDFLNYSSPANYGYAVFGHVVSGMDVVNKIKGVETTSRSGHQDVPVSPVVIKEAKRK